MSQLVWDYCLIKSIIFNFSFTIKNMPFQNITMEP